MHGVIENIALLQARRESFITAKLGGSSMCSAVDFQYDEEQKEDLLLDNSSSSLNVDPNDIFEDAYEGNEYNLNNSGTVS
jgi:hypothetical protein